VAFCLVGLHEIAKSRDSNLETLAQVSPQTTPHAPPIPVAGPLADPKSLNQVGLPVEATRMAPPVENPQTPEKIALGEKFFLMDDCRLMEPLRAVHAMIRHALSRTGDRFPLESKAALASATLRLF
jgi:hypothetical protein